MFFSGYMSPEYAMEGLFSVKSDVFSFGVLLLEIVSGLRNAGFHQYGNSLSLLGHVSDKTEQYFVLIWPDFCNHIYSKIEAKNIASKDI